MSRPPPVEERGGSLVYPLPVDARLGTFDRFDFYHRRFLRSALVQGVVADRALAEAALFSVTLWSHSFEETPVGTIPADTDTQAHMVGLGAAPRRWRAMAPDATRGFRPLVLPCGTPLAGRLAHPVMLEVAREAWGRHLTHKAGQARNALNARRTRFRKACAAANMRAESVGAITIVDRCLDYIAFHDLSLNAAGAREAVTAVTAGWQAPASTVVPLAGRA